MQTMIRNTCRAARRWCRDLEHGIASQRDLVEARDAMLESPRCREREASLLGSLVLRVHPRDGMYRYGAPHYLASGLSGLHCIERSLAAAGKELAPDAAILDFPSGFGRVLRFLRVAYPEAALTAGELDPEAIGFCRALFQARPLQSVGRVESLELGTRFDLIWCGSLLTHLDEAAAGGVLAFFRRHLAPDGLCVFSAHGERIAQWLRVGRVDYGLPEAAVADLLKSFDGGAYGFACYPGMESYGISLADPERMQAIATGIGGWEARLFLEHGWDACQDVHAFQAVA